ncbi:MAG: RNA polymerase sigma factor [Oscillospiraceae bacterium]|nr:RNA polymerase sigma factor [Oscillospiraceae bacterium]
MMPFTIESRESKTPNPQISIAEFDVAYIVENFGDMMYKLATAQLNNMSDAYDVVQDVLLKIHVKNPVWNNPEHIKLWLVRAVINCCRDYNKKFANIKKVKLNEVYSTLEGSEDYELQEALANLSQKYRITLYLHYYEGYKVREIAEILSLSESAIKKRLVKGREMIKKYLES